MDVLIVGAGVAGLSCAVVLAEAGLRVTVDSAEPPERSTSAAAGAVWEPYLVAPRERALAWAIDSLQEFRSLAADPARTGVRIVSGTQQSRTVRTPPHWIEHAHGRMCGPAELVPGYASGWRIDVPVIDAPVYLRHLCARLLRAGGRMRTRWHRSLGDARALAPIVVNCTGAGARSFVPDSRVAALKGQLVVVENPGLTEFFCDDTPGADEYVYFFPHGPGSVTLGGSQVPDEWTMLPDPAVARAIVRRCALIDPRLATARIVDHRVGVRPMRPEVRLEREAASGSTVVHNYGHGAAGVTVSWGCALEVAAHVHAARG